MITPLLIGLTLDSIIGDPYWLPHPIRAFGWAISSCEKRLNRGENRKLKGAAMAILLMLLTFGIFFAAQTLLEPYAVWSIVFGSVFFFYGVSNHSLIREALKVERMLQKGDVVAAREQLSWIVGRDTAHLNPSQIRIATLETLSENLSDGVIAPILYYAVGGIPLMMAYKMVNTMDSMVGYKNERFLDFGCFAARMDDVANYIPARLTALLIALTPPSRRAFSFIAKYGRNHASPNSGYPESALAGRLDCRFGGANYYGGKLVEKPYIGDNERAVTHKDVIKACCINVLSTVVFVLCYVLVMS